MQTLRAQLEERLNEVTRRAYQLVGRTDEGLHA
jgi:tRNA U38,U39,U40 pseudouridine synthase TruA